MDVLARFKIFISAKDLIHPTDHILIALSGGPDSVAMFDLFMQIMDDLNIHISVAHFNHGLRGAEADNDAKFVSDLCQRSGIECYTEKGNVAKFARDNKLAIEQAARLKRYEFLDRVAANILADKVATGHTQNDQAETVLYHFLRGSGFRGLRGIPLKRGQYIRPILWASRKQILEYLDARNLGYRIDSTNFDVKFVRNKIRHELLPEIKSKYNPNIISALYKLSDVTNEGEEFLYYTGQKAFEKCLIFRNTTKIVLDILSFLTYFKIQQKYMIIIALEELGRVEYIFNYNIFEQIIQSVLKKKSGKKIIIDKDFQISIAGSELVIARKSVSTVPVTIMIDLKKDTYSLWDGWILKIQDVDKSEITKQITANPDVEIVDKAKLTFPIIIRTLKRGDRFYPLNLGKSKKLSDFFIDEKVPFYIRDRIPILLCGDEIIWICGYRLDDRFKVTDQTTVGMKLELLKEGNVQERVAESHL